MTNENDDFDPRPCLRAALKIQQNSVRNLERVQDSCKAALADLERALEALESIRSEIALSLEQCAAAAAAIEAAPVHARICVPAWDAARTVEEAALAEIHIRNFARAAGDCASIVRELVERADESRHAFLRAREQAEQAHLAARKESEESLAALGRDRETCSLAPAARYEPELDWTRGCDESREAEKKLDQLTKAFVSRASKKAERTQRGLGSGAALPYEQALGKLAVALVREACSIERANTSQTMSSSTLLEETANLLSRLHKPKEQTLFPLHSKTDWLTVLAKLTISSAVDLEKTIDGHWDVGVCDTDITVPVRNPIRELKLALETLEPKLGP